MAGLSRLNPVYLAGRHAGTAFMLLAAGVAVGVAARGLAQPVHYSSTAEAAATATGPGLDWEGKDREWRTALAGGSAGEILSNNLRHAVKLAATAEQEVDAARLAGELLLLKNGSVFPASLLSGLPARMGPSITVRTEDIAENLDAQSLAVIAADLDPPPGGAGGEWDFSFFRPLAGGGVPVFARPSSTDYYFRVFYRLHALLSGGREPAGPEEARRGAVAEVASRLERESQFPGGGGFGPVARQELMREIQSIPVLAANGLYGAGWGSAAGEDEDNDADVWLGRWAGAEVSLRGGGADGTAAASVGFDLYPLMSPRDTAATRVQSLAATVMLAYFAAREAPAGTLAAAEQELAAPAGTALGPETETVAEAAREAPVPSSMPTAVATEPSAPSLPKVIFREEVDEAAAAQLRGEIRTLEESLLAGRARIPDLERRFAAAREDVARLSSETRAARARADRFKERYDEAARVDAESPPAVSAETARLLAEREGLATRLAGLLLYCTEEHPFVVEVRRNMSAIDVLLKADDPAHAAERDAEARAGRIANLYLEWETVSASADGLDERLRRRDADAERVRAELTNLEGELLRSEAELTALRLQSPPTRRVAVEVAAAEPAVQTVRTLAAREVQAEPVQPSAAPASAPAPALAAAPALRLSLSAHPSPHRQPPGWEMVAAGLLAGLLAAAAAAVGRELWGKRFHVAREGERLVGIPLLAALPAYDGKSMRAAAKTMKGEVVATKGGLLTFSPPPVDFSEPPPAAKRGKIRPRGRRVRAGAWAVGVLFIALAGWLHHQTPRGFVQPRLGELSVPVFVVEPPESVEGRP